MEQFFNLYNHGFIKTAVCIPEVRVADPDFNTARTVELAKKAVEEGALFTLFPELGISAYSNEDLFHQDALLEGTLAALETLLDETRNLNMIMAVGAPLRVDALLFNCGLLLYRGKILGIGVKSYLPNYREFYEGRQFSPAEEIISKEIDLCGQTNIPFGADLLFEAKNIKNFSLFLEICEDVWVSIPPSSFAALAGATVIANLSASNITVGKAEYRTSLVMNQSARLLAAYLYAGSGPGESTTDLAWDGHAIICENGNLLAESQRFSQEAQIIQADIDLDRLVQDRMRMTGFGQNARTHREAVARFRKIPFTVEVPAKKKLLLSREYARYPYIPSDQSKRDQRCYEAYNIQVGGLAQRVRSSGLGNLVIGVSGGLDSTHALIVTARTMDLLGLPRTNIKAYTMPGFATSEKTYANATALMKSLGVEANEIDIRESCRQMFRDIGHPFAQEDPVYDITFENVQAGERTSHLFRIANLRGGDRRRDGRPERTGSRVVYIRCR